MAIAAKSDVEQTAEMIAEYAEDPLGFVLDCFCWGEGILEHDTGPDEWQRQFLEDLGKIVKSRKFDGHTPVPPVKMAIASGHGIGKSTLIAWLHWWIMSTRPYCRGRVTANTFTQLSTTTWAEIQKWHKLCITKDWFEVTESGAYAKEKPDAWFSTPLTCAEENSEAFAGQHAKESTSFFLFDESSLIPDIIWQVAEMCMTDGEPMIFAAGNPTRNTGEFYEVCFGDRAHRWNTRSIDSRTCKFPNHILHEEWIQDHGIDSDFVKVRIRGLPPSAAEDQLISRDLVRDAQQRKVVTLETDPLIAGVDVPDGGSAWFVVRFRRGLDSRPGPRIPLPIRVAGSRIDREAMVTRLAELMRDGAPVPGRLNREPVHMMFIDAGFGAAIVERLHALRYENVQEIAFGGKSPDPHYGNMRAYMWAKQMKDWLLRGAIDPEDKKLAVDLCAPGFHFKVGGDGALLVESKDDMRDRGIASPDDGDALALTFARHVAPVEPEYHAAPRNMSGNPNSWMR